MKYMTFCRGINNIDNQLDATVTDYYNSSELNMFQAIILPIFRSTRLCVTAFGIIYPATGGQHRPCIIPQAVIDSLVLLKMGKIIAGNMLS